MTAARERKHSTSSWGALVTDRLRAPGAALLMGCWRPHWICPARLGSPSDPQIIDVGGALAVLWSDIPVLQWRLRLREST